MAFSDALNKVKEWAGKNPDKADSFVDKGTDAARQKFAGHDKQFDTVSDKAKEYLHGNSEKPADSAPPEQQGPPEQQPPR
ncbi:MAG TPA: antitoxin [Pseudonocardia sp.]|jgi:hypothetical protein|nr:antitoxin [Pseudonocardia sp.]